MFFLKHFKDSIAKVNQNKFERISSDHFVNQQKILTYLYPQCQKYIKRDTTMFFFKFKGRNKLIYRRDVMLYSILTSNCCDGDNFILLNEWKRPLCSFGLLRFFDTMIRFLDMCISSQNFCLNSYN